jgi:hypothetical protein
MDVTGEIRKWFEDGARDFDRGFELLKGVSRNPFFMNNILRRRDLEKVRHELNKIYCFSQRREGRKEKNLTVPVEKVNPQIAQIGTNKNTPYGNEVASSKTPRNDVFSKEGGGTRNDGAPSRDLTPRPLHGGEGASFVGNEKVILRKEFVFLEDSNCPEEFKVLVADMITSHTRYVKAHDRLYDVANKDNDQCFKVVSDLVENYIDNRNMWEELEHFKKTGKILGDHRIFTERKRREIILQMGFDELKLLRINLQRRIAYRKRLIQDNREDVRVKEWMDEIYRLEREKKIAEVKRKKSEK